jgi:hypothetical protein
MSLLPSKIPASAFETGSFARAPTFPAMRFTSQAEFREYLADSQSLLDARYAYEQSLATSEASIVQSGTCAPCLRSARFTSRTAEGTRLPDGRYVPNWREAMQCDCRDQLNNRHRAVLHFVQAAGIQPWTRLLLAGPPSAVDLPLSGMVRVAMRLPETGLMPQTEAFHLAVSHDHLQHAAAPQAVLAAIRGQLLEGGRFIFTAPFHHEAAASQPSTGPGTANVFGWDLLDMLRQAGFRDAAAYLYWSEELGYLGPMNFIFRAVK